MGTTTGFSGFSRPVCPIGNIASGDWIRLAWTITGISKRQFPKGRVQLFSASATKRCGMDGFDLFQLSGQMRGTPEFQRLQELDRFSNTLRIFEANYRELDRLLLFICDGPAGDQLFRHENRSAWEQAMAEVIRLLQNFVAAVSALVD